MEETCEAKSPTKGLDLLSYRFVMPQGGHPSQDNITEARHILIGLPEITRPILELT